MRRSLRAAGVAIATTALGLSLVVTTTSPASAAEPCPAGKYCLYDGADYTKLLVTSDTKLVRWIGAPANDKVSSIVNNTDNPLNLFKNVDWDGVDGIVAPHSKLVLWPSQNNNLSSYYLY
jgi:hypothetical protein